MQRGDHTQETVTTITGKMSVLRSASLISCTRTEAATVSNMPILTVTSTFAVSAARGAGHFAKRAGSNDGEEQTLAISSRSGRVWSLTRRLRSFLLPGSSR